MAAYLHGIRSLRVFFRSNAVAVSPLVMHISATTVNNRTAFCSLDLTSVPIKARVRFLALSDVPLGGTVAIFSNVVEP